MFWEKVSTLLSLSFREMRMLQRLAEAFGSLPCLLLRFKFKQLGATVMAVIELFGALFGLMPLTPRGQRINLDEWDLVWSDEFDGGTLDTAKWSTTWNHERRGGYWHGGQCFVEDGSLRIRTEYKTTELGTGWHSGLVETKGLYEPTYGYFEVSCVCPGGNGLWAAFWFLSDGMGAPPDGSAAKGCEIDVFESGFYGHSQKKFRQAVNQAAGFDGYAPGVSSGQILGHYTGEDIYEQFNTFGLEWNENEIIWYINGVETDRMAGKWVPQTPHWLILSVEVAGSDGNPGIGGDGVPFDDPGKNIGTNDPGVFPLDFIVDYVRVYERKG